MSTVGLFLQLYLTNTGRTASIRYVYIEFVQLHLRPV
jgi:hypothetical protein